VVVQKKVDTPKYNTMNMNKNEHESGYRNPFGLMLLASEVLFYAAQPNLVRIAAAVHPASEDLRGADVEGFDLP
jgi:hypothetical protein